jgi:hypothetical protein
LATFNDFGPDFVVNLDELVVTDRAVGVEATAAERFAA